MSSVTDLTLGEIRAIERAAGQPFTDLGQDGKPQIALLIEVAYALGKRANPNYTHGEAEALTMTQLNELLAPEPDGEPDFPTQTTDLPSLSSPSTFNPQS